MQEEKQMIDFNNLKVGDVLSGITYGNDAFYLIIESAVDLNTSSIQARWIIKKDYDKGLDYSKDHVSISFPIKSLTSKGFDTTKNYRRDLAQQKQEELKPKEDLWVL